MVDMKYRRLTAVITAVWMMIFTLVPVYAASPEEIKENTESDHILVLDDDTGQVLLDKYGYFKIYPASMTKLMAVLIGAERLTDPDAQVTITQEMIAGLYEANASSVGWTPGTIVSVRSLLYGALLPSGADAVHAIAFSVCGSVDSFVGLMNEKASQLGLSGTHFTNPTGLHDPEHYSTCADIAVLLSECHKIPLLHEIMTTPSYTDEAGYFMKNTAYSAMLSNHVEIIGYDGGKTGYTDPAGHCLASYMNINGMHLITVTAHAMTPYADIAHIRDTAYVSRWMNDEYAKRTLLEAGQTVQYVTLKGMFSEDTVAITADTPLYCDLRQDASLTYITDIPDLITLGTEDQTVTGTITVLADGKEVGSEPASVFVPREKNFFVRLLMRAAALFD